MDDTAAALRTILLAGAPEGFDARLLAREVETSGRPLIHVGRDDRRMEAMRAALAFFAPGLPVLAFPAWDCLPFDRVSPHPEVAAARLATLAALAHGGLPGRFVLLTTVNAATQRLPARATIRAASLVATVGRPLDAARLRGFLVRMGYAQSATVAAPGDFAVRGGIIDVWPPGAAGPVRLDLFGDILEGARRFDPLTQRTTDRLDRLELAAASEVILDAEAIARFRQAYRAEFGAAVADDPVYAAVSQGRKHAGLEHWLPYFHDRLETLFEHLPGATVALDDQAPAVRAARWDGIAEQYAARQAALADRRAGDNPYRPCPPARLYLDEAAWTASLQGRRVLQLAVLARGQGPGVLDAQGRQGRDFALERQDENISLFDAFAAHLQERRKVSQVIVASYSDGARERLKGLLEDHGIAGDILIRNISDVPQGTGGVHLVTWALEHGFEAPGLTVISEQDVLGDRLIRAPKRRRRAEAFLREAESLAPGDLVVHVEHGIGRFRGLETITAMGAPHECIALEYAGGDRLFLPVENIELLSRYGAEEGTPDRLGGGAWQARKARLKERIRDIADRLIRVAAERQLRAAPVFAAAGEPWEAFCARFPYVETDDQLAAIADVLTDLDRGTPMDRLIVGDVGFGKTEVAMRAAFIVAMAGAQVAVITPTTLLARQHFRSFSDRFRGTPLIVRQLSRFVPAKAAAEARAGLADGRVDIVVGTHALLARAVGFSNLGLLVVDEEQHFGVAHKERLKELRSDVHVLTLTATPIPRTLQMALAGVRDLSVIATPPIDRLAVRTYVSEFDPVTIREALLRERFRGGQSFFVVPRIADLPEIEAFLAEQVPEVKVVTAHGQMPAALLDERMNAFYDGRYDVLLSTSIVESGLDIPTANTMIVHRADMFGLAQLYQLRGRVGRAKLRAHCFLTTRPRAPLTATAEKRLRLLGSLDSLGAGFNLAAHDLDLRGAGNVLGEEQSGHIREVGHELYQQMLEEAVARLKAGEGGALPEAAGDWSPQINLGVPVLIPEAYVPDLDVRLGLYRRLAALDGKVEVEGFAAELIDRFGPLPREVGTLLLVVRIKAMCRKAGIARFDGGPRGATIQFRADRFANPAGLVEFLAAEAGAARIRENRLIVRRDWTTEAERIRDAFAIALELARKARAAPPAARPG